MPGTDHDQDTTLPASGGRGTLIPRSVQEEMRAKIAAGTFCIEDLSGLDFCTAVEAAAILRVDARTARARLEGSQDRRRLARADPLAAPAGAGRRGGMSAGFCPDCNHDRSAGRQMISFAPDHGWMAEFTAPLAPGQPSGGLGVLTRPDGTRIDTWRVPVLGWAVTEHHYEGMFDAGHERHLEAVLLDEEGLLAPMSEYREECRGVISARIMPAAPGARPGAVA
jgi:hypothetical protein